MLLKGKIKNIVRENAVELSGVVFAYDREPVLRDVNIKIASGEFAAILGANGAAKTTLMKIMVGLLKPRAGRVMLLGQEIVSFKSWGDVGYISQRASHINTSFPATVREVVASGYYTGLGRFKSPGKALAVEKALGRVGIEDLARRRIGEMSGGQRQRVFLAKALVKEPKIIFLDEPTTGIDPHSRKEFYALLEGLHDKGTTIVMVTHDLSSFGKDKTLCLVKDGGVSTYKSIETLPGGEADVRSFGL